MDNHLFCFVHVLRFLALYQSVSCNASTSYCHSPFACNLPLCLCLCLSLTLSLSAPGHVQKLLVQYTNESSVGIQWHPPLGEWDKYSVYLTDLGGMKKRQPLNREINECSFHDLTPGKEYNITVVTHSGNLTSATFITTHTSETLHP